MIFRLALFTLVFSLAPAVRAQNATIRGTLFDQSSGEVIPFGTVTLRSENTAFRGTTTDPDGFFSFTGLSPDRYQLTGNSIGYDSLTNSVTIGEAEQIEFIRLGLETGGVSLTTVDVSARRERDRSDVAVSQVTVTSEAILALPSTGGTPDIAQYLTVLPGVVSTGDQGGQLYIRGGSPVQNRVLLDGMTIYNPFHSIGLFSVFETEAIRAADVYTGGFNAEYGGRISAIVDITTRAANKTRFAGLVSASPFQAKALVEAPIKKLDPATGSAISLLVTAKQSLLPQTSPSLYGYAVQDNFFNLDDAREAVDVGLPYDYRDLYGKLTADLGNGSVIQLFGFNFTDDFSVGGLADLNWDNAGGGLNVKLVPARSNLVIDALFSASAYEVGLLERGRGPRSSGITNYTVQWDFSYLGDGQALRYGIGFDGVNTDFSFVNPLNVTFRQENFTSEVNAYAKYKRQIGGLVLEPGVRVQYYASLNAFSLEPRLGLKYNVSATFRLKAAGGRYSQNLISTQNDLDIVNFFTGLLTGPENTLFGADGRAPLDNNLQTAWHGVVGAEIDLTDRLSINLEGYLKDFDQLLELNRNKLRATDPDFVALTGEAYGGDLALEYRGNRLFLAGNYSLGFVNREDAEQAYPTSFDRRHNVNLYGTYAFGRWEAGLRLNYGSPFPFTQTQGFVEAPDFSGSPVLTNILTGNGNLGVLLSPNRNGGRLSDFHRLDLSLKRDFSFGEHSRLEVTASVTNTYNRENIFYVDRISSERVNQLPILPSLSGTFYW